MSRPDRHRCVRVLIRVAMDAVEDLPPADRADAYDGLAIVAAKVNPEAAQIARQIAEGLRDCELRQGQFRDLFKDA
jgi:hypothetical protein